MAAAQQTPAPTPTPHPEPQATPRLSRPCRPRLRPPAPSTAGAVNPTFFNPAIAVIGNFLASTGNNPVNTTPAFQVRESEVSFQAVVDPYARADLFLSFNNDGVEVEEGYITFLNLPWQTQAKAGKFKVQFGKINTLHLHVLPWVDEPLPLRRHPALPGHLGSRRHLGLQGHRAAGRHVLRRSTSRSSTAPRAPSSSRPIRAT